MPCLPSHLTTAWYISAPSVLTSSHRRASVSLSRHTYMVRPLCEECSDISHPAYSSVHPPGHWSVPGIMS